MAAALSTCSTTSAPVGWAKIVRIAAATISADPRGTRASTLRRKCTRQRCRQAPAMTADGLLEAGGGVGDDQLHPGQPAGLERAQERGPEGAVLAVADVQAQHLPAAVGGHAGGDDDRAGNHAGLEVGGVTNRYGSRCGPASATGTRRRRRPARRRSGRPRTWRSPASTPRALTRSSTLRVEVPCT
jgi:hypothetical protein